jgi:hypothetical protein
MAAFPDVYTISPENPESISIRFKTLTTDFESGDRQSKAKQLYPERDVTLQYAYISKANAQTLWQFFIARKGRYEAFNYFTYQSDRAYVHEYVGTGDGSTVVFNLPSTLAASYTLYVGGTAQTAGGTDWTFTAQGGTDSADKCEFTVAPVAGARITFSFTGRLKIRVNFEDDALAFDTWYDRLVTTGIRLRGRKNA